MEILQENPHKFTKKSIYYTSIWTNKHIKNKWQHLLPQKLFFKKGDILRKTKF